MTYSLIHSLGEEIKKINKLKADDKKGLEVYNLPQRDWRGLSYKPLFKPIHEDETINRMLFEKGLKEKYFHIFIHIILISIILFKLAAKSI